MNGWFACLNSKTTPCKYNGALLSLENVPKPGACLTIGGKKFIYKGTIVHHNSNEQYFQYEEAVQ